MSPEILLGLLAVLLVVIAGAFAWQEQRSRDEDLTVYSVEDSIRFVTDRLDADTAERIRPRDVRRILEWEVLYLHRAATDPDVPAIAGGLPSAAFAQETLANLGYPYDGPDIIEVLDLRAEYLASIGAIGDPLTAAEVADLAIDDPPEPSA